jgi:hypothetical protein
MRDLPRNSWHHVVLFDSNGCAFWPAGGCNGRLKVLKADKSSSLELFHWAPAMSNSVQPYWR